MLIAPINRSVEVDLGPRVVAIIEEGGFTLDPGELVIRLRLRHSGGLAPIVTRDQARTLARAFLLFVDG